MSKRCTVFAVLSLIVMIGIFMFSAKNGEESTDQSLKVGMAVGKLTVKNFDKLPEQEQISFAKKINLVVRKSAHFTEYMLLGLMLTGFYTGIKKYKMRFQLLLAWLTGTLYACTDEFHQRFVPGRACSPIDVMIDSSGVLTGVLIMTLCLLIIRLVRRKRAENKSK